MVHEIEDLGIANVILLTGDRRKAADAMARVVGISHVEAELLPEQKLDRIKQLQVQGRKVAMIGDGVNDAPAWRRRTLGWRSRVPGRTSPQRRRTWSISMRDHQASEAVRRFPSRRDDSLAEHHPLRGGRECRRRLRRREGLDGARARRGRSPDLVDFRHAQLGPPASRRAPRGPHQRACSVVWDSLGIKELWAAGVGILSRIDPAGGFAWLVEHRRRLAKPAAVACSRAWMTTSLFTIGTEEVGVIERFGRKVMPHRDPGLCTSSFPGPWTA